MKTVKRFLNIICSVSCLALSQQAGAQSAPVCKAKETLTAFGSWFSPAIVLGASQRSATVISGLGPQVASLRFQLTWLSGLSRQWRIAIRDPDYRTLATFGPEDLKSQASNVHSVWTSRLPFSKVFVELIESPIENTEIEITAGLACPSESPTARLFSTQSGTPQWTSLFAQDGVIMRRVGAVTGMMVSANIVDGEKRSWCCSGTMISSELFMTNWHCGGQSIPIESYWNADICDNTLIDLNWDDGKYSRQYSCASVVTKDQALDVAILALRPVVGIGSAVGQPAFARIAKVYTPQRGFVIHHAKCARKLVSTCDLLQGAGSSPIDFQHQCDTEPGASGSGVFDSSGRLVGLHHSGFDRDDQCHVVDKFNKATRIEKILSFLKNYHSEVFNRLSLD